jgi:hypothetical protein
MRWKWTILGHGKKILKNLKKSEKFKLLLIHINKMKFNTPAYPMDAQGEPLGSRQIL